MIALGNESIKILTNSRLIDYMTRRPTHLAERMARDNRVVNLCSSSFKKRHKPGVITEKGWQTQCYHWLPLSRFSLNKKINHYFHKRFLRKHIKSDDIVWAFEPFTIEKYRDKKRKLLIYEMCDDTSAYFKDNPSKYREVLRQEEIICREADLVFTISEHLLEKKKYLNENFYVIRNGVDFDFFNKSTTLERSPEDELYSLKPPIVGYHGAVSPWIDFTLLKNVANQVPDINFVFVGRIKGCEDQVRELSRSGNIHFLGEKPYGRLIHYLKYFDLTIIPFLIDQLILSVNPIKMYEYLAAGKPVLSAPLPEVVLYEKENVVETAGDAETFAGKINRMLAYKDDPGLVKKRIDLALKNTWDSRYLDATELIRNHLDGKN